MSDDVLPNNTDKDSGNNDTKINNDNGSDVCRKSPFKPNNSVEAIDRIKKELNGGKSDNSDCSFNFILDETLIDTTLVKRVGIDPSIKSIVVDVNRQLIVQTIHLDRFAERTIIPLKKQLTQVLKNGQNQQDNLPTIYSIVTCINRNIDLIRYPKDINVVIL